MSSRTKPVARNALFWSGPSRGMQIELKINLYIDEWQDQNIYELEIIYSNSIREFSSYPDQKQTHTDTQFKWTQPPSTLSMEVITLSLPADYCNCNTLHNFWVWFKYNLGEKYPAPQVQPHWGLNSWPPDHDSTFHVTETPAITTRPSATSRYTIPHLDQRNIDRFTWVKQILLHNTGGLNWTSYLWIDAGGPLLLPLSHPLLVLVLFL